MGGRIKVKRNETSKSIIIETEQQLNELLSGSHQDEAFSPRKDGPLASRNNNTNSNNNNSNNSNGTNSNDSSDKSDTSPQQQPQTQQITNSNQQIGQLSSANTQNGNHHKNIRVHTKIRSDLNKQRTDSKDRAYRRDFKFDDRQPPQSNPQQQTGSNPYRKRFPSPQRGVNKSRNRDNRSGYGGRGRYERSSSDKRDSRRY